MKTLKPFKVGLFILIVFGHINFKCLEKMTDELSKDFFSIYFENKSDSILLILDIKMPGKYFEKELF
ncbi:MAG: hypothetical protein U0W24_16340 [Bacteroidales bacterium]